MDYPYENLNPEKFQEFTQALLSIEFPDLQCLPVAQPDGGRDILSYLSNFYTSTDFIVYQVKYVRKPLAIEDPHKWLLNIIKKEIKKVKILVDRGASKYILITNIQGTAHLDSGSIDKMNTLLGEKLEIPSRCWWRDDLNRKLDNAWNLKWSYPELMTGPDLIRTLIESSLTNDKEKRSSAIKAFVAEQFNAEQVVKFKQVDLQNRLLDLFIDVPALPPKDIESKKHKWKYNQFYESINFEFFENKERFIEKDNIYSNAIDNGVGSATLLLNDKINEMFPYVLLEGAPGQGKSTITQYICQIHRMRLLGSEEIRKHLPDDYKDSEGLDIIPYEHKQSHICLPFRIDLRDLASWLSGDNPFYQEDEQNKLSDNQKSLEEFLSFLVNYHSGGLDFSASDLVAVFKNCPVLLVFDGLDEVADIEKRREVIDTIHTGSRRLKTNTLSLQIIVTSRPAAFENSPGLPVSDFPRFYLASLTKKLIDEYANKWMKAKKLNSRDRSDLKKILRDKLDQPHLKDLAKNPMQLTIFLSLIYNRGSSLPDKRTALYDSYVDLFFNREAEKTPIVKKHRDLLLDIHKYIAWKLHSEAEQHGTNGSITKSELDQSIQIYLEDQGYGLNIASELVVGALERIVAIVSRVEGTYEFEVQPLREYFAARYLYETAHHSPAGQEASGTKPDRFDALSRNFYWLNVTRFYAGCYDKGELPSLIDRLEDLISSDGYCLISYPRLLAGTLLSDWVFSQHPKSVKKVMELVLDDIGLRYVLPSSSRRMGKGEAMILPHKCGHDELITHCFNLLSNQPPFDFALDIINLISANIESPQEIYDLWLRKISIEQSEVRKKFLEYGLHLGIISQPSIFELSIIESIYSDIPNEKHDFELLFRARRFDYIDANEDRFTLVLKLLLECELEIISHQRRYKKCKSPLEILNYILSSTQYELAFYSPRNIPLCHLKKEQLSFYEYYQDEENIIEEFITSSTQHYKDVDKIKNLVRLVTESTKQEAYFWATNLTPWNNIVEQIRQYWGDTWICFHLANIASGVKSSTETCSEYSDLLDSSTSLCKRARYARLRAGQPSWWLKQINHSNTEVDNALILLIILTWASQKTIYKLINSLDELIENLPKNIWEKLYKSIEKALSIKSFSRHSKPFRHVELSENINPRTALLISLRANENSQNKLFSKFLKKYNGSDSIIIECCYKKSLKLLANDYSYWNEVKEVLKRAYIKGNSFEPYSFHILTRRIDRQGIPEEIAIEISSNPEKFPGFLVGLAEIKAKEKVAKDIIPVGDIAVSEKWFDHL